MTCKHEDVFLYDTQITPNNIRFVVICNDCNQSTEIESDLDLLTWEES